MEWLLDLLVAAYTYDIPATVIMFFLAYWHYNKGNSFLNTFIPKGIMKYSSAAQGIFIFLMGVPFISFILWGISLGLKALGYAHDFMVKIFDLLSILYGTFVLFPIPTLIIVLIISFVLAFLYRKKRISVPKLCVVVLGFLILNLILSPILKEMSSGEKQHTSKLE